MKISLNTVLFSVIAFQPLIIKAQLSICYDHDGYTNVRKLPSINGKVIGKIIEGQAFAIASYTQEEENKSTDWIAINFPTGNSKNVENILKFSGEEQLGYVHKSRLIRLEDLSILKRTEIEDKKIIHHNDVLEVTIETQTFLPKDHKIVQKEEGNYLIDDKNAFRYYGGETTEIKSITLKSKNKNHIFPPATFKNLFGVSALNTKVYEGKKNEYYIEFDAGDGSDSYNIVYCWKNGKIFSMTVTSSIP